MNLLTFISVVFILYGNIFSQECLVLNGTYQGMNVYVQNPFASNGVGFSTQKVTVNGEPITDNIISSTFEIDLKKWNFKYGDSVSIKIYHNENYTPRIIDNLALTYPATLTYENVKLDSTGLLKWCAVNEISSKNFYIEQYKWNRWIVIGQIQGTGGNELNCYEFQVDLHSGENKVRLVQETHRYNNNQGISPIVKILSAQNNIKKIIMSDYFNPHDNGIAFSQKTNYIVYNKYYEPVLKGFESYIDLYDFDYGYYIICFDNQISTWYYNSRFKRIKNKK